MRINHTKKDIINSIYMQLGFSKKICENLLEDFSLPFFFIAHVLSATALVLYPYLKTLTLTVPQNGPRWLLVGVLVSCVRRQQSSFAAQRIVVQPLIGVHTSETLRPFLIIY